MKKYQIVYVLLIILFGCLPAVWAGPDGTVTQQCVLEAIDGAKLIMVCEGEEPAEFMIAEEIKITDITGRPINLWQLPLPGDVEITHKCLTEDLCSYVIELVLQRRIEPKPQ